jgi:hypothetical protein
LFKSEAGILESGSTEQAEAKLCGVLTELASDEADMQWLHAHLGPLARGGRIPVRLRIAALAIRAAIVPEVIDIETGTLGMPANIQRLGWWRDGMAPMARSGTILTAGHYDFATAGRGAFYLLPRARPRRADPDHHRRRRSPHISRRHGGQLSENRLAADRVRSTRAAETRARDLRRPLRLGDQALPGQHRRHRCPRLIWRSGRRPIRRD